jgi:predicted esterase
MFGPSNDGIMNKVLYIHGLGSSPVKEKLDLIQKHAEVVALHLDYENDLDSYKKLLALAKEEEVSVLIGSSLGGLISYHMANNLGLPCLLFNPALYREIPAAYGYVPERKACPRRLIIQGALDDIVDPAKVRTILAQETNPNCKQEIIINAQMGHRIDLMNFEHYVNWFFTSKI